MKYKTFKYKDYNNCYFIVNSYNSNKFAMAITIFSEKEEASIFATVYMKDYLYLPNTITIRNYSDTSGMTEFLEDLGIIEEIYSRRKCHPKATENETIDYCCINVDKLKEYTKEFNYEFA